MATALLMNGLMIEFCAIPFFLFNLFINSVPSVTVVDHYKCTGAKQIAEELKKMIALGAEGLMIRKPRSEYVRSRSDTLLKIKKFYDAEVSVILKTLEGNRKITSRFFHFSIGI